MHGGGCADDAGGHKPTDEQVRAAVEGEQRPRDPGEDKQRSAEPRRAPRLDERQHGEPGEGLQGAGRSHERSEVRGAGGRHDPGTQGACGRGPSGGPVEARAGEHECPRARRAGWIRRQFRPRNVVSAQMTNPDQATIIWRQPDRDPSAPPSHAGNKGVAGGEPGGGGAAGDPGGKPPQHPSYLPTRPPEPGTAADGSPSGDVVLRLPAHRSPPAPPASRPQPPARRARAFQETPR